MSRTACLRLLAAACACALAAGAAPVRSAPAAPAPAADPARTADAAAVEGMALRIVSLLRTAPEVARAEAELGVRAAEERSARVARYPRLDLQGEVGSLSSDLARDPRSQVDSRLVVGTRYTVFDFGRNAARIGAAERGVAAGQHQVRQRIEGAALEALTAYLQVLRFGLLVEVGRDSENALRGIERLEGRRVELGGAGITDARLAASRLALSGNRLVQFETSLAEARAQFAALFGFSPLPQRLPPLRVPAAWLAAAADQALEQARERSPELQAVRAEVEQARRTLEAERAARWPAVDLTWSRRYEFPGGFNEKPRMGVLLSTSSSNLFEGQARVQRAAARVADAEERQRQLERDLGQAVQTALQRHVLGRERLDLLRTAAADSALVFRGRQRLNAAGRETTLALLDAQVEANNVLIDWVNALFDQRQAELRLARETGQLLPPPGDELAWARGLFATEDFRAPVREQLQAMKVAAPAFDGAGVPSAAGAAAPPQRTAVAGGPPASLGALGAAWSLRLRDARPVEEDRGTPARSQAGAAGGQVAARRPSGGQHE